MTRKEIVEKIKKKLGRDFIVSEAWADSQEDSNKVEYVVVRIDYLP
jgi:hypothetical protein